MDSYVKVILYLYPKLEKIIKQIDETVVRRAFNSRTDYSSCESQAERILYYIEQKCLLIDLKFAVDEVMARFTDEEKDYFEYKFFKRKEKDYRWNFDAASRRYFRKQNRLTEKAVEYFRRSGLDKAKFEQDYLPMKFIADALRRINSDGRQNRKDRRRRRSENMQSINYS